MKLSVTLVLSLLILFSISAKDVESKRWKNEADREKFASLIVGYNRCGECHKASVDSWKQSHHYKSLDSLNNNKNANEIIKALKLKGSPVSQKSCAQCHFTDQKSESTNQFTHKDYGPVSGISCESCHGPSRLWEEIHNKTSWKELKDRFATLNSAEKKKSFLEAVHIKSAAELAAKGGDFKTWKKIELNKAGMITPKMTYSLINNCYECHTIGDKDLINKTADLDEPHAAGSEFEIISWLSGEVRHNFQGGDKDKPLNRAISPEKKRYLYLSGKLLFTEHAVRALQTATFPSGDEDPTRFYDEMLARLSIGIEELIEINDMLDSSIVELKTVTKTLRALQTKIEDEEFSKADLKMADLMLADYLKKHNKAFLKNSSKHASLKKLDETINEIQARGTAYQP